jgi:hypothetical protein
VKEDDPVTAILKGVEDVIRGESTENACETFEDWKNIETADDIILEMLIADLAKTAESADQHEETDCDKPSFDLGGAKSKCLLNLPSSIYTGSI